MQHNELRMLRYFLDIRMNALYVHLYVNVARLMAAWTPFAFERLSNGRGGDNRTSILAALMDTLTVPKLVNGRGTLPISRRFGKVGGIEVGHVRIASGTTDGDTWRRYNELLDDLVALERGDLILAVVKKERTLDDLYRLFRAQKLAAIPKVVTGHAPLLDALTKWLDKGVKRNGEPFLPRTLKEYRNGVNQLMKHAQGGETVKELPSILKRYRDWCIHPTRQYFAPFNNVKTVCLAFARATEPEKQFSDLYKGIAMIDGASAKRKRERNAISLWELRELMSKLKEYHARVLWTIALTGLRYPSEYNDAWSVEPDRIVIAGTKTENAKRFVPRIDQLIAHRRVGEYQLREAVRKASNNSLTPYDIRGTYRRLLSIAVHQGAVERSRAKFYFGHSMTLEDGYETHEFADYLLSDAEALRAIVHEQIKAKPKQEDASVMEAVDWDAE